MEKLTYLQICRLVESGRKNEIPSGYNLIWVSPEPQELFDFEISGENIVVDNGFPNPSKALVIGEYHIIPSDIKSKTELLNFGDVYLRTNFILSKLIFEYDNTREIRMWMNDKETKHPIKKSDTVFNTTLISNIVKIEVFNVCPQALVDNRVILEYDWAKLIL